MALVFTLSGEEFAVQCEAYVLTVDAQPVAVEAVVCDLKSRADGEGERDFASQKNSSVYAFSSRSADTKGRSSVVFDWGIASAKPILNPSHSMHRVFDIKVQRDLPVRTRRLAASPSLLFQRLEPRTPLAANPLGIAGIPQQGLTAEYFTSNNLDPSDLAFVRTDPTINFDWGIGSPNAALVPADGFSVRWTGFIVPKYTESHTFVVQAGVNDGLRLRINGNVLIEAWNARSVTAFRTSIALIAGQPTEFQLDYREGDGHSRVSVRWISPSSPLTPLPEMLLIPQQDVLLPAGVLRERWEGIDVSTVGDLRLREDFRSSRPSSASAIAQFDWLSEQSQAVAGQRLRSLLVAPETGPFTFYLASGGPAELLLSNDALPMNAEVIATTVSGVDVQQFDQHEEQVSSPVYLVGGEAYYFSLLQTNSDHASVAWSTPSDPAVHLIPAQNFRRIVPTIELRSSVSVAAEDGEHPLSVTFTRDDDFGSELTVGYMLGGEAIDGEDYVNDDGAALGGFITFAAGSATAELRITPLEDETDEELEDIVIRLSGSPTGAYLLGPESSQHVSLVLADEASELPANTAGYDGRELDSAWRSVANQQLAEFRQNTLVVEVRDGDGNRIEGARVSARLVSHDFQFQAVESGDADDARYLAILNDLFNGNSVAEDAPTTSDVDGNFSTDDLPSQDAIADALSQSNGDELPAFPLLTLANNTIDTQVSADFTRDLLTQVFSHPESDRISLANFQSEYPLFESDWSVTPAGQTFVDLISHRWQTQRNGTTRADGTYSF
ncbi:MAG: PA14 domain-containing protein [Rubripirellula sp.]